MILNDSMKAMALSISLAALLTGRPALASTTPTTTPTGLMVTAGDTKDFLNWSGSEGAASYNVYRSASPGGPFAKVAAGIVTDYYTDAGLVDGAPEYYEVSAVNAAGETTPCAAVSATPSTLPAPSTLDLTTFVDPMVGTETGASVPFGRGAGYTYPGAQLPFGMVELSPDTRGNFSGGYDYDDTFLYGFSHNHLSGPGCPILGQVLFTPTLGAITNTNPGTYGSTFSHDNETASPGYYSVLLDSGIHAELTATTRTGWHRYTFPASTAANVMINLCHGLKGQNSASLSIVGNNAVEGEVTSTAIWNYCDYNSPYPYTVYFYAQFSQPAVACGTWTSSKPNPGSTEASSSTGSDCGAYLTFNTTANPVVVAKVGISYTSIAEAKANLTAETTAGNFDFDAVSQTAHNTWNTQLHAIEVSGGSSAAMSTFYTALYHSLLFPSTFSDADGSYIGFDNQKHVASGTVQYTNFSMWDTYRTEHPLLTLIAPSQDRDMMQSLLNDYTQGGWLPRFPIANGETNSMLGDPVDAVIADAYTKGIVKTNETAALYTALLHNATMEPPLGGEFEGRLDLSDYVNLGYVPFYANAAGDLSKLQYGSSITLEYALDDAALAQVAKAVGDTASCAMLTRRSLSFLNQLDTTAVSQHPRLPDTTWLTPFSPASDNGFKEDSGLQYTWDIPQDVPGMIDAIGGNAVMQSALDSFFTMPTLTSNPVDVERHGWMTGSVFDPTNEPGEGAPYAYYYIARPISAQRVLDAAHELYSPTPAGIPGEDDLGALSSWYVMTSIGLYPYMPGDHFYILSAPAFESTTIYLQTPFYKAPSIQITAPRVSGGEQFIQSMTLNGALSDAAWVDNSALISGLSIDYVLGTGTNAKWGTHSGDIPPAVSYTPTSTASAK